MKIAALQCEFCDNDKSRHNHLLADRIYSLSEDVGLVVLPELHSMRYFAQSQLIDNFDLAEDISGDTVSFFRNIASNSKKSIITSIFEKSGRDFFNTCVVIDKNGEIAAKYRKIHIPQDPGFEEKFYFKPGNLGWQVVSIGGIRVGLLICWDQWFPESARILALRGADVIVAPTAIGWTNDELGKDDVKQDQLNAWVGIQTGHAIANGVYWIAVNRTGVESDINFWGNSFVCDPIGRNLYSLDFSISEFIVDIDLNHIKNIRNTWPFMRDRRPNLYSDLQSDK